MQHGEEDQRGYERRLYALEQRFADMHTTVEVTKTQVAGLAETIKSRFTAFDRGIDLILERLTPIGEKIKVIESANTEGRLTVLEAIKNKAAGAILLVQILGVLGIVGGIIAIIKQVKGI